MDPITVEIVKVVPSVLWFLLVTFVIIKFYKPIRYELFPNLKAFSTMGVEFSFVKDSIDAAVELAEKSPNWKVETSITDRDRALRRAKAHVNVFRNSHILWVDDHPEFNTNERRMFRQLQSEIETARNTQDALTELEAGGYDIVISDMARDGNPAEGLQFLDHLRAGGRKVPVVFYVGVIKLDAGVPVGAFGITNRPDELLHLTLDALERTKY